MKLNAENKSFTTPENEVVMFAEFSVTTEDGRTFLLFPRKEDKINLNNSLRKEGYKIGKRKENNV